MEGGKKLASDKKGVRRFFFQNNQYLHELLEAIFFDGTTGKKIPFLHTTKRKLQVVVTYFRHPSLATLESFQGKYLVAYFP